MLAAIAVTWYLAYQTGVVVNVQLKLYLNPKSECVFTLNIHTKLRAHDRNMRETNS